MNHQTVRIFVLEKTMGNVESTSKNVGCNNKYKNTCYAYLLTVKIETIASHCNNNDHPICGCVISATFLNYNIRAKRIRVGIYSI